MIDTACAGVFVRGELAAGVVRHLVPRPGPLDRSVRKRRAQARVHGAALPRRDRPARWRSPSRTPARASATSRRRATPTERGDYLVRGSKIFISGGDHDLTDNIVHLVLARIDGAPPGTKGISLFAIPKWRTRNGIAYRTTSRVAGMIHKIGWRGLPSLIMSFGERGDCRGWLVGEPNQGLSYMFQMMNEARIGVGLAATATASVAYRESLEYARTRAQGRPLGARGGPQVPIVEHADVRRMLLRQKAICEGSMALVARDRALRRRRRARQDPGRARPSANCCSISSRRSRRRSPPKAASTRTRSRCRSTAATDIRASTWPRRGCAIKSSTRSTKARRASKVMDLLGRKVMAKDGAALRALAEEIEGAITASKDPALAAHVGAGARSRHRDDDEARRDGHGRRRRRA